MRKRAVYTVSIALGLLISLQIRASDVSLGEVEKVDSAKNRLELSTECECGSGKIIEVIFTLKSTTKITLNGKDAKLGDIKHGDRIEITYEAIDDVQKVSATRDG